MGGERHTATGTQPGTIRRQGHDGGLGRDLGSFCFAIVLFCFILSCFALMCLQSVLSCLVCGPAAEEEPDYRGGELRERLSCSVNGQLS